MSVKQGGKTIAGATQYHPDLFDYKWADHILDDAQWLMANPFSWQYGSMYQAAYANLSAAILGKTLQSETVAGITVQFYLADDRHKICPASEENNVMAIYNTTGIAWYYIIDTTNQRFKLPRAKHNKYADTLGVVGNGMTLGLTNGTNNVGIVSNGSWSQTGLLTEGAYNQPVGTTTIGTNPKSGNFGITTDPTKSGIIAQQEQDTDQYKYLYFYVGAFTQTAIENTAGLNTELFNGKADLNLNNVSSVGKDVAVGWNIPDYSAGIVVASDIADYTERTYTAPADGVVAVYLVAFNGQDAYIKINDVTVERVVGYGNGAWVNITGLYPVKKGSVIKFKDGYAQVSLVGSKGVTFYPFTK